MDLFLYWERSSWADDGDARGFVDDAHGGGDFVDVLPAVSAGVEYVDAQVVLFYVDLDLIGLGQHGHGGS